LACSRCNLFAARQYKKRIWSGALDTDINKIAAGDHVAFSRIIEAHQGRIFGYLGRMGLDRATAEDIAQETFLRLWRSAWQFDAKLASPATWILTIARNLALTHLARPSRRVEIMDGAEPPDAACDRPRPDEALQTKQQRARLRTALERLAPADRSLLAASYIEDLGLAEIARLEGCTTGAVKVRLHRARARLREILEKDND
jgi:RNA polymerase sigma-70 factor (ECF subfamily)